MFCFWKIKGTESINNSCLLYTTFKVLKNTFMMRLYISVKKNEPAVHKSCYEWLNQYAYDLSLLNTGVFLLPKRCYGILMRHKKDVTFQHRVYFCDSKWICSIACSKFFPIEQVLEVKHNFINSYKQIKQVQIVQ